jgi:hypothetical protein
MPGSQTTRSQTDTRDDVSVRVAFRQSYGVGTPEKITYAAQWLAYTLPCRRFTDTLAGAGARLGADADRYPFIAADFHRLLLAGLPAHNSLIRRLPLPRWRVREQRGPAVAHAHPHPCERAARLPADTSGVPRLVHSTVAPRNPR